MKRSGSSLMLWGCFSSDEIESSVKVEGVRNTSNLYSGWAKNIFFKKPRKAYQNSWTLFGLNQLRSHIPNQERVCTLKLIQFSEMSRFFSNWVTFMVLKGGKKFFFWITIFTSQKPVIWLGGCRLFLRTDNSKGFHILYREANTDMTMDRLLLD